MNTATATTATTATTDSAWAHRVVNNTLFLALGNLGTLAIGFILTPIMLGQLGLEQYGLWALLGGVLRYFGLLDFGFGTSFVRHVAEHAARRETAAVCQVTTFGLLFYLGLGALIVPATYVVAPHLVAVLQLSPTLVPTATNVLVLVVAYFFAANALSVFSAVLVGLQKMHVTAIVGLAGQVVYALSLLMLLSVGLGIYAIVAAMTVQLIVTSAIQWYVVRRTMGVVFVTPMQLQWAFVRRLLGFGGWMQLNNLAATVSLETDRFIIGSVVAVSSVSLYEVGNKLAQTTLRFIPLLFLQALLPGASVLAATGQHAKLAQAYRHSTRVLALVTLGIGGFVVSAAVPLLQVWLGQPYPQVPTIVALLALAFAVNNLTGVGTTICRASGKPEYETGYAVASAALNIAATIVLTPRMGLLGVLVGTVFGTCVSSVGFVMFFHHRFSLSTWSTMGCWLWRLVLVTIAAMLALAIVIDMLPANLFTTRAIGATILLVLGVAYLVLFAVLLRLTRIVTTSDLRVAVRVLPSPLGAILRWRGVAFVLGGTS